MWQAPTGQWTEAGSVALDPSNPRRLILQPGQGVMVNGQTIHENVEPRSPTGSAWLRKTEIPDGPLLLQVDHGPVAFRNVRIRPLPTP